jgi:zinc-binding alcohol dehydrogenase family protein
MMWRLNAQGKPHIPLGVVGINWTPRQPADSLGDLLEWMHRQRADFIATFRRLTGLTVIGTASRPETQAWVRELGAHHVIDHSRPLGEELKRIGFQEVSHVVSLTHSDTHFPQIAELIAPQGKFGLIDDPTTPLDVIKLKAKSVSLHWELMFTRSLFQTADMIAQHRLLSEIAALVDAGIVRTTLGEHYGRIDAANLKRAHALIETGKARGKIVLESF